MGRTRSDLGPPDGLLVFRPFAAFLLVFGTLAFPATTGSEGSLVLHLTFDAEDQANGLALDRSGYGNHATLGALASADPADPRVVPGVRGEAYAFGVEDTYLTVPSSPTMDVLGGDVTVAFWVRSDNHVGHSIILIKRVTCGEAWPLSVGLQFGGSTGHFSQGTGVNGASTDTPVVDGTWHHVAFVRDMAGGVVRVYVDGVATATAASDSTAYTNARALTVGRDPGRCSDERLEGELDDLRIYASALPDADIAALAERDMDGDGYGHLVDCDDADAEVHPTALDVAGDGIDQDCTGEDLQGWIAHALPSPQTGGGLAAARGFVYVAGGDPVNVYTGDGRNTHTRVLRAPVTADGLGLWEETTPLPYGVWPKAVEVAGHVMVAGGPNSVDPCNGGRVQVGVLDVEGHILEWRAQADLPLQDGGPALAASGRHVFFASSGAIGCSGYPTSRIYSATMSVAGDLTAWRDLGAHPGGTSSGVALAASETHLYFLGGDVCCSNAGSTAAWAAPIGPDGSLGPWTRVTDLPTPKANGAAAVVNGHLHYVGGWVESPLEDEVAAPIHPDGSLGSWQVRSVQIPNYVHARVVHHGDRLVAFHVDAGGWTSVLERPLACGSSPTCATSIDGDRDGAVVEDDCDDTDPARHPGAIDVASNGIDEDCDDVPPWFEGVLDLVIEAEGPGGASVAYDVPTAHDDVDADVTVDCVPTRGSMFPLGRSNITCVAEDGAHQQSIVSFSIVVQDTTPPELEIVTECSVSGDNGWCRGGIAVTTRAEDLVGVVELVCTLDGQSSPCDITVDDDRVSEFRAVARDAAGHSADGRVSLRIDATPPVVSVTSPTFHPTASVRYDVVWTGVDGGSGLSAYAVTYTTTRDPFQVRDLCSGVAAGASTVKRCASPDPPVNFVVCYRGMARDLAGNTAESAMSCTLRPN